MAGREWEENAAWWQEHFTGGADPEYEEQILPLVDVHLAGTRRVLAGAFGEMGGQLYPLSFAARQGRG